MSSGAKQAFPRSASVNTPTHAAHSKTSGDVTRRAKEVIKWGLAQQGASMQGCSPAALCWVASLSKWYAVLGRAAAKHAGDSCAIRRCPGAHSNLRPWPCALEELSSPRQVIAIWSGKKRIGATGAQSQACEASSKRDVSQNATDDRGRISSGCSSGAHDMACMLL